MQRSGCGTPVGSAQHEDREAHAHGSRLPHIPDRQLWLQLQEAQVDPGRVGTEEHKWDRAELCPKDEAADNRNQDEKARKVLQDRCTSGSPLLLGMPFLAQQGLITRCSGESLCTPDGRVTVVASDRPAPHLHSEADNLQDNYLVVRHDLL